MQADVINRTQAQEIQEFQASLTYPEYADTSTLDGRRCHRCQGVAVAFSVDGRRVPVCGIHGRPQEPKATT